MRYQTDSGRQSARYRLELQQLDQQANRKHGDCLRDDHREHRESRRRGAKPQERQHEPKQHSDDANHQADHSELMSKRRPLTQYGTAQEIMHVFSKFPEDTITPGDFEQATASFEELRKADLSMLPPVRPAHPALATGETPEALSAGNTEF